MKCAEVMEWMHRYLDHDLSQDEMIEMFRHIDNCPSCADVFERLTLLSQELEQLPDVKPPFSLVDSILPQLDKLDLDVQQHSTVKHEEPSTVVPITRKSNRSKAGPKGASLAARTGIGAVAAAVILFIAVFNMPDSIPQAEVESSLLQETADTASNDGAMSKMATASTGTAGNAADNSGVSSEIQNDEPEATAFVGVADPDVNRDANPAEPSAAPNQRSNNQAPSGSDAPGLSEAPAASKVPAVSKAPAVSNQTPPARHKTETAAPSPEAPDTGSSGNNSIYSTGSGDVAADEARLRDDSSAQSTEAGIMGMLPALVAQDSWSSPDGRYSAELAGQQLVIYSLPAGGVQEERTAVTSLPLEGTWVSGSWTEDGRQFTYVTLQDGTEITKVYTVPETSPSVSPSASPQAPASAAPGVTPEAEGNNK